METNTHELLNEKIGADYCGTKEALSLESHKPIPLYNEEMSFEEKEKAYADYKKKMNDIRKAITEKYLKLAGIENE